MASSSFCQEKHNEVEIEIEEKHDVFLSFRGEDTRNTFASYLYAALSANQISTFMDHELQRGDEISPTLTRAIEESKISVVILSQNYAQSTWCLDELIHILECRRRREQIVIPIFYGVDPSVVRKQKSSYGSALAELEQRFGDGSEKVRMWRNALTEVSSLCGLDSKDFRPEGKLVRKIVEDVLKKLPIFLPSNDLFKGLVGIEKNMKEIKSLMSIGSKDVRIIGIWGMGGIGKTTLATVVFHKLLTSNHFDACCFLRNVREEYARFGLDYLRRKLVSNLLNAEADINMDTLVVASPFIVDRLRRKKVLIVLDDVETSIQLDALVEGYHQLAFGGRIVVTTRNKQVLTSVTGYIHKVEGLNQTASIELFNLHAFGENSAPIDDEALLKRVVSYADGNPLALKVLGSFLCSRSKRDWESAFNRLKRFPNPQIQDVLQISYEGLDDKGIKDTFLDIACLFNSSFTRDQAESILGGSNSFVKIEIDVLIEKSLIENDRDNEDLWMHDLLRQMGRSIVRAEDKEPGNRSRLCDAVEACEVLENSTGTKAVEVISFSMFDIRKNVKVSHGAFANMHNLRILKMYYFDDTFGHGNKFYRNNTSGNEFKLSIPHNLDSYLSNKLRYFQWDLYPLKCLPSNFNPENLVELVLCGSHVVKLWDKHKILSFPVLRSMDLRYSKFLIQLPDLSQCQNLESINLKGCISLVEVFLPLHNLHKLTYLDLSGCSKLRDFQEISKRTEGYLDTVRFGGIKNILNNFTLLKSCIQSFTSNLCLYSPQAHVSQKFAPNLKTLDLSETAIETVTPSIGCLSGLFKLDLTNCRRLKSLPTSISHLQSLNLLNLSGCEKLKTFPEILEPMEHLTDLSLDRSGIKELPESIGNLVSLRLLNMTECMDLEFLPSNLCNLRSLEKIYLDSCTKFSKLASLPPSLLNLHMEYCERLKLLPELPSKCLSLYAWGCTSLENISKWRAPQLRDIIENEVVPDSIDFCMCGKLDQNTCNTVLADHAVLQVLSHLRFVKIGPRSHQDFRYPGDEIPKWFKYQTCGTSISNIMLQPHWNNDTFLGFAFCIVHADAFLHKINEAIPVVIHCKMNFKTIHDGRLYSYDDHCRLWKTRGIGSDHVVIWHLEKQALQYLSGLNWPSTCSIEASFDVCSRFSETVNDSGSEYGTIKKFGVRFVYAQDLERFDAESESKNKRHFNECCESSGSEVGSHEDEDNDESHSKKLRVM